MYIVTKTITLYGYKCDNCGAYKPPQVNDAFGIFSFYLSSDIDKPSYCGMCGSKLSEDIQSHNNGL